MTRIGIVIALLIALGVAESPGVRAQSGAGAATTAVVEVTVWRAIADPAQLYVSTRPAGGRWRTLNTPLDLSQRSASGRFHQSNAVRVDVPLGRGATAAVEVTVWRAIADPAQLYVSTRPAGGRWRTLNTPLDLSQRSASGRFHQSEAVRVAVAVPPPPVPDLVVDSPTVSASRPMVGQAFALGVTVRNRGTGAAEDATVIYYRSDDPTFMLGDTELGRDWVAGLAAASGRSAESLRTQAPAAPGTYYYGACVEAVAGEAKPANNCSPAVAVSVTAFAYEQLPWVADGLTGEEPAALERIRDLARVDVAMSQRVAGAAWLADGVTEEEVITLNGVVFGPFAERYPAIVSQLTTVPDRTGHLFKNALQSVGTMLYSSSGVYGPGRLEQLQQQAWFRDGLTEEEAALIVGLHWITGDQDILEDLLRDGQVRSETITLSLAGAVDLYAVGRSRLELVGQLERMRPAAEAMETFLGTPWPQPATVAIVELESHVSPNYDGWIEGAKQNAFCPHTLGRSVVSAALRDLYESGRGTDRITTADAIYQAFLRHAAPAQRDTFRRWYTCLRGQSTSERIPPAELREAAASREALAAFYHATNGPGWTTSTNWLSAAPLDQWHGVSVGGDGAVVELDLADNQISGPIPAAALGRLTQLRALRLAGNQLSGPIPPDLGGLARLEWLSLGGNQLSGPIPSELGNLARLRELSLGRNQLSGPIPPELGNLARLVALHLSQNQLSGPIPPALGNLARLTVLSLGGNQLSEPIPSALGGLANLTLLHLSENQLSGPIPPALGRLTQLQSLNLGINQLSGPIPPALGGLAQLKALYLWDNQLRGPIPPALGTLTQLTALGLGDNALTGCVPPSLWELPEHDLNVLGLAICDDS